LEHGTEYQHTLMKATFFVLMVLLGVGASIYAGPEPISEKEMKQVAPAPPGCPNWTGFYIGGFGGYKFAATDVELNLGGAWNGPSPFDISDRNLIEKRAANDLDTGGGEAGGFIGYNYQWQKWVFGVEAAGGYLWLRDSDNTGTFLNPFSTSTYSVATSLKTHYLFTFAPRIGYAFCRWLPYVTGGLAVGDIVFDQAIIQHNAFGQEKSSVSQTNAGWMVGGGLQYALTDHWSIRAQYQYIDLDCADFHSSEFVIYTGKHEACLREHNASFALMYRF
jgi:outer membrane immunogenic protein